MPGSYSSSYTNCDLPLSPFSLLVTQFGTSSELLISRLIVSVCFSLSRRFKAYFFVNLFCREGQIQLGRICI
ncbi:unnamed protein product [Citrullus colocynthis]|uniref:Uncharacterized protein n=1 Tax=Citrullus colocynthis TaxID=252529 RepID=A0ABP0XYU7_9ROSI